MRRALLFAIGCFTLILGDVQANIWLDDDWQPTQDKQQASFYLKNAIEPKAGHFRFEPYYLGSDIMQFSGTLSGESLSDNAHPVGAYRFFAKDGTLVEQGEFNSQGQRQGLVKIYDGAGKLNCDCQFDKGIRQGLQREYYGDGRLKRELVLHQGEPIEQEKVYSPMGHLVRELCHTGLCSDRFYDKQGRLTMESQKRDGLKHGVETFWRDGQVEVTQAYLDGKQDGDYFAYFPNGQIKQHHRWQNDFKVGEQLNYFEDGRLAKREILDGRGRTLSLVEYRENGERYREAEYDYSADGDVQEVRRFYHRGSLSKQIEKRKLSQWRLVTQYHDGKVIGREETQAGKLTGLKIAAKLDRKEKLAWLEKIHYRDGLRHGPAEKRGGDNSLFYQGEYALDKPVGDWQMQTREMRTWCHYNAQGQLDGEYLSLGESDQVLERINYQDGEPAGRFERFYADGEIYQQGQYVNGQREGKWIVVQEGDYSPQPKPLRTYWQGEYRAGKQVGRWERRSSKGYGLAIAQYDSEGRRHGVQYDFYADGALRQRSEYRHDQLMSETQPARPYRSLQAQIFALYR